MTNRLAPFSNAELSALLFSLEIAATVEPLTPEAARSQQEVIRSAAQDDESGQNFVCHGWDEKTRNALKYLVR